MFAHDLCHSRIKYLSLRFGEPTTRRGILSILIEKTERSDTANCQYSIVNIQFSGLSGLGLFGLALAFHSLQELFHIPDLLIRCYRACFDKRGAVLVFEGPLEELGLS